MSHHPKASYKNRLRGLTRRCRLEPLESRCLLSVTWTGGAGTHLWSDAANWLGGVLPAAADDVAIGTGATVEFSNSVTVKSLSNSGTLVDDGTGVGSLAVADSMENHGTIEVNGRGLGATITVGGSLQNYGVMDLYDSGISVAGTLTNETGATITSEYSGTKTENWCSLTGNVDNEGTITVSKHRLSVNPTTDSSVHTFTFTNGGTINIAAGAFFAVSQTFDPAGGAIAGSGILEVGYATATFAANWAPTVTVVAFASTITVNTGTPATTGTLTNAGWFFLSDCTINANVVNQGTLAVADAHGSDFAISGQTTISGQLAMASGSKLILGGEQPYYESSPLSVEGISDGTTVLGSGKLAIAGGLTNHGNIIVSSVGSGNTLTVSGTLDNASGGNILCDPPANSDAYIIANLTNEGTITAASGHVHINNTGENMSLPVTGNTFVNTGTLLLTDNADCIIGGIKSPGYLGTFQGEGSVTIDHATWSVSSDWTLPSVAGVALGFFDSTITVAGTLTNVAGSNLGIANSTINATIDNLGTINVVGSATINAGSTYLSNTLTNETNGVINLADGAALAVGGSVVDNGEIDAADGTVTCNGTLTTSNTTIHGALVMGGQWIANAGTTLDGVLTADVGSTITYRGRTTLNYGFSNFGTIVFDGGEVYVSSGNVVNEAGATITTSTTSKNYYGALFAQVDNRGTINVSGGQFSINPKWSGSPWTTWYDSTRTLTNTGTIRIAAGGIFTFGGQFDPTQGIIRGDGGLMMEGATLNLSTDWTPALSIVASQATIQGKGTLTIAQGLGLGMSGSSVNTAVACHGTMAVASGSGESSVSGESVINGSLTTWNTSVLVVGCNSATFQNLFSSVFSAFLSVMNGVTLSDGSLTVANGFTNHGQISLYYVNSGSSLIVGSGTLLNAADGAVASMVVQGSSGSSNTIVANIENQGIVNAAGCGLTVNQGNGNATKTFLNESQGKVLVSKQTLTIDGAILTNEDDAAITLGPNATLDLAADQVTFDGNSYLAADSTSTVHVRGSFSADTTNSGNFSMPGVFLLDGHRTASSPQQLEVLEEDLGEGTAVVTTAVTTGYDSSFAFKTLQIGNATDTTCVKLVGSSPTSADHQAGYANALVVAAGSTLDRNGLHLYYANNAAPTVTVNLNTQTPRTNEKLTATVVKYDLNGDPVTLTFVWKVNGIVKRTFTSATAVTDTFDLRTRGDHNEKDKVSVTVTATDGKLTGTPVTVAIASFTVKPTISSVSVGPLRGVMGWNVYDTDAIKSSTVRIDGQEIGNVAGPIRAHSGKNYYATFGKTSVGLHHYTIFATDVAGHVSKLTGSFTTPSTGPIVSNVIFSPSTGTISWHLRDSDGVASSSISIKGKKATKVTGSHRTRSSIDYTAKLGTLLPGTYKYTITAIDKAGNVSRTTATFTVPSSAALSALDAVFAQVGRVAANA